jgi:hypothetical protein
MFAANTTEQDDNCTLVRKSNQTYHLPTACTAKSLRPYDTSCFDTSTPLPPADLVPVHAAPATHQPGPSPRCHHWPGLRHRLMSLAFLPACGGGQLSRALKLRLVPPAPWCSGVSVLDSVGVLDVSVAFYICVIFQWYFTILVII